MKDLIIVRGGGDIATGTIYKLKRSGFPVLVLESVYPASIRRQVCFSEAVYDGSARVEGMEAVLAANLEEAKTFLKAGQLTVLADPKGTSIAQLKPQVLVDGILAKRNCGTTKDMAPLTIGLGPGFYAGVDVDVVVETKRGHHLGRLIYEGPAAENTGIPGTIGGYTKERVIYAPESGRLKAQVRIGDLVEQGQTIAKIRLSDGSSVTVEATINGVLRGMIRDGFLVKKGLKIVDIDPRSEELTNCFCISDKARCIAGGVLEAVLHFQTERRGT